MEWTEEVASIVQGLPSTFRLEQVYAHVGDLATLYPQNYNIEAKIRQQLQVLRDQGMIRFLGDGRYEKC